MMQLLIKARHFLPDVMIVDVNMPELDGLTVCTQLHKSLGKPVELVVVTGYTHSKTIERCENLGAFYVRKGRQNVMKTLFYGILAEDIPSLCDCARRFSWPTTVVKLPRTQYA
jgi:CheY-like chemotaxis protein